MKLDEECFHLLKINFSASVCFSMCLKVIPMWKALHKALHITEVSRLVGKAKERSASACCCKEAEVRVPCG